MSRERKTDEKAPDNSKVEFFALVESASRDGRKLLRSRAPFHLPLDQNVSTSLTTQFKAMADTFFESNSTVVPFDGRYTPGPGEMFVIETFELDPAIEAAAKNPFGTSKLNLSRSPFPQIKALLMSEVNSPVRIIFQEFKADQIIRQGRALFFGFMGANTFNEADVSGISIGNDIDAVYDDGKLWFRSYYAATRCVDLSSYFHEATNDEIRELLQMDGIVADDAEALLAHTDAAMRRRFTTIRDTGILNLVTPEVIKAVAAEHNIEIEIDRTDGAKRIVVPSEKAAAKEVLDFLCQSTFYGSLTKELFVANSFRPKGGKKPVAATKTSKKVARKR